MTSFSTSCHSADLQEARKTNPTPASVYVLQRRADSVCDQDRDFTSPAEKMSLPDSAIAQEMNRIGSSARVR